MRLITPDHVQVELRLGTYRVVANDESRATQNRLAIQRALLDHPEHARFALPVGVVYVDRDPRTGAGVRFAGPGVHDVALVGRGPHLSALVMTGNPIQPASSVLEIADGAARVLLVDFTVSQSERMARASREHHLLRLAHTSTQDVVLHNVLFGPCSGPPIAFEGDPSFTFVQRDGRCTRDQGLVKSAWTSWVSPVATSIRNVLRRGGSSPP
jgi:hypothetical protein